MTIIMLTQGCPLPVYDIDPEFNQAIVVNSDLVTPPLGAPVLVAINCDASPVEFRLEPALSDPDDDDLDVFWLVNREDDLGQVPDGSGFDFNIDPCDPTMVPSDDDTILIEAFAMDRKPLDFTVAGVHESSDDGYVEYFYWLIEITERGECFCP
jgi:hypothetical protein